MTRFPILYASLLSGFILLALGCTHDYINPPQPKYFTLPSIVNSELKYGEALTFWASGMTPGEYPVSVEVFAFDIKLGTWTKVSETELTADRYGRIKNVILAYDAGIDPTLAQSVEHQVVMTVGEEVSSASFIVTPSDGPVVYACDISGNLSNAFLSGEPVFVTAKGLVPGEMYRVWPLSDRREWSDGDVFESWGMEIGAGIWPDDIPEFIEITADDNGEIVPTQLMPYATKVYTGITDQFDVMLDAAPFGTFNVATDAVDGNLPTGVVVQDPAPDGHLIQQLASREDYTYTDTFHVGDEVYIWLNPGIIIPEPHLYVQKYIVEHLEEWLDGTPLGDITSGIELDVVQTGCVNEGLILAWFYAQLGEYDVLIDMNSNGIYDEGTDILDWSPAGPGLRVIE